MPRTKSAKQKQVPLRTKAEWLWSKRYRVWDANRRLFLYPENWIEPETRLPTPLRASLREIVGFVCQDCEAKTARSRKVAHGKGVPVLFLGPGRARALASAHALARDLGLDLRRVDLSAVVSKYIGETEKNLRRIFDTAKKSDAVLFFDEADALFGKRGEVKDSHDRYANLVLSYLLQGMEGQSSPSILAMNKRSNIDDAFLRRMRFTISLRSPAKKKAGA